MRFLLPFLFCLSSFAGWNVNYFDGRGVWHPVLADSTTEIARFTFRQYNTYTFDYMVGGIFSSDPLVIGDLIGKTITLETHIENDVIPQFMFGGQFGCCNTGSMPPHYRVFITSDTRTFNAHSGNTAPTNYWWSELGQVSLNDLVQVPYATITVNCSSSVWTDGWGERSDGVRSNDFQNCLANVAQVGIMFGGGNYFDNGVSTTNNVPATFVLDYFEVHSPVIQEVRVPKDSTNNE